MSNQHNTTRPGSFTTQDRENTREANVAELPHQDPRWVSSFLENLEHPEIRRLYDTWQDQLRAISRLELEMEQALSEIAKKHPDRGPVSSHATGSPGSSDGALDSIPNQHEKELISLRLADGSELPLDEIPWCNGPVSLRTLESWMVATLPTSMGRLEARCQRSVAELTAAINRVSQHVDPSASALIAEFYLMAVHSLLQHSKAR